MSMHHATRNSLRILRNAAHALFRPPEEAEDRQSLPGAGYRLPPELRQVVNQVSKPAIVVVVGTAVWYLGSILTAAFVLWWAWAKLPLALVSAIAAVSTLIVARQMRGLECLVHEGSHYNWYRGDKRLNDRLTNWFAAWPLASEVRSYRVSHHRHHALFGSDADTDLQRYRMLAVHRMDRSEPLRFALGLLVRLPRYWRNWFTAIGTSRGQLALAVVWHAVVMLPFMAMVGPATAFTLWSIVWLLPMVLFLPVIRFIGEAGEHRYPASALGLSGGTHEPGTVFEATISNIGWIHRLLFHPFGDGYHNLHHRFPGVPGYHLARLHRLLKTHDPQGYGARLPQRHRVLMEPALLATRRSDTPGATSHTRAMTDSLASPSRSWHKSTR